MTNIPPFYVGQKVVYITGINMPKGSVHVVRGLYVFSCDCCVIDIGLKKTEPSKVRCCHHDERSHAPTIVRWFKSTSFRPLHEATAPLMTFCEIKEKEKTEILIPN